MAGGRRRAETGKARGDNKVRHKQVRRGNQMPYKKGQSTLMGFLGMAPVMKATKTRLFGEPYILFGAFLLVCLYLYENGAILGRARSDKLTILAKLFPADLGKEESFINTLQNIAQERLNEYTREFQKEPSSFFDIFYLLELKKAGLSLADTNLKTLKKALGEKCSLKQFEAHIKMSGLEGIGFGSCFLELTEKMYRKGHENINMDVWNEMKEHGATLSEEPTVITLEEQEELVLQMVAAYTSEYYPELLDPLDLRGYVKKE
jgi:hypothetical protein